MSENRRSKIFSQKNLRRAGAVLLLLGAVGAGTWFASESGLLESVGRGKTVEFVQLTEEEIPQSIVKDVIPEYRELERALGCLVDGKVYVVVTRGEKPTAGYDLAIQEMKLEKTDTGQNLIVRARFIEPPEGEAVPQVITFPYQVAETVLESLPDTIELVTIFE